MGKVRFAGCFWGRLSGCCAGGLCCVWREPGTPTGSRAVARESRGYPGGHPPPSGRHGRTGQRPVPDGIGRPGGCAARSRFAGRERGARASCSHKPAGKRSIVRATSSRGANSAHGALLRLVRRKRPGPRRDSTAGPGLYSLEKQYRGSFPQYPQKPVYACSVTPPAALALVSRCLGRCDSTPERPSVSG